MENRRNNSKKRDALLALLRSSKEHPSAERLHTAMKEIDPGIGIATVYRNLTILQEDGVIRSVGTVDGQERYDADFHPHGHFICHCCGRVMDVEFSEQEPFSLFSSLAPEGCVVKGCDIQLNGLCRNCSGA